MIRRLFRLATLVALFGMAPASHPQAGGQEPVGPGDPLVGEAVAGCPDGVCGPACRLCGRFGCGHLRAAHGCGPACHPWQYGNPDLFYNFYVPNNCGGVPAALYVAPLPVPQFVGHTYYTYQPFMPHEFLYPHYRTYRKSYDCGRGINRTFAAWYSNPVVTVVKDVRQAVKIPR
jgi:hypothetical protein